MLEGEVELVAQLRAKIRKHRACKGYGHILKDGQMVLCECKKDAQYQYRLAHSGIPPKFKRMGFSNYLYKASTAYTKIQEYLTQAAQNRTDGVGLFLSGPSFTGKSLLACSLLMELMKLGYDCKYLSFDGILDGSKEGKPLMIDKEWDFLVLDRVGDVLSNLSNFKQALFSGERTHGAVEFLTSIITRRVNVGRPLILPCTVSLTAIDEKFPSLANVLVGSCILVDCEDNGFRQKRINLMMEEDKQ